MKKSITFKKDKYKSARGGYSRLLYIFCRTCDSLVLEYQKDGHGNLRRAYMYRIFSPPKLTGLQSHAIADRSVLALRKLR